MSAAPLDVVEASILAIRAHEAAELFADELEFFDAVRRVEFYPHLDETSRLQFVVNALEEEYMFSRPDICKFWLQLMRRHLLREPINVCINTRVVDLICFSNQLKKEKENSPYFDSLYQASKA